MGEMADAKLAEDLSFYTDFLGVKKNRQNEHNQIMIDDDDHKIIVKDGGKTLSPRKPYASNEEKNGVRKIRMVVRNMKELEGFLKGMVKRKELTQAQADEVIAKAKMSEHIFSGVTKNINVMATETLLKAE